MDDITDFIAPLTDLDAELSHFHFSLDKQTLTVYCKDGFAVRLAGATVDDVEFLRDTGFPQLRLQELMTALGGYYVLNTEGDYTYVSLG